MLRVRGLSYSFDDRRALAGVDLDLSAGQILAVLGPNGSGKSTLIRCLFGQLRGGGSVDWFDRPLKTWDRRELAKKIAYLPQSPTSDPGQTVTEVLRTGRAPYWGLFGVESPADTAVVADVADQLGLTTDLHRPVDELSGGQRQRVFVGRCLVQQPAVVLLDEPNTFLDLRNQVELCQLLKRLSQTQSLAVVMAVHDLNLAAAYADRFLVLSNGTIAAAGGVNCLTERLLSDVYGLPMRRTGDADRVVLLPSAYLAT